MIAVAKQSGPFGSIIKKIGLGNVLFYLYMVVLPFLGPQLFMKDANDEAIITFIVLWYAVPIAWLVCTMTVNIFFEKQFGSFYNNETDEMDHTRPIKRKLVLWFAPIMLPYYIVKVSIVSLRRNYPNIRSWIAQKIQKS